MKRCYPVLLFLFIFITTGCVSLEKVTAPRVDQSSGGNRGFLNGEAPAVETAPRAERTYLKLDVEIPTYVGGKAQRNKEVVTPEPEGVYGPPKKSFMELMREKMAPKDEAEKGMEGESVEATGMEAMEENKQEPELPSTYTVRKNERLWDISKKLYGSGNKWTKIYEANREKIPNPDRIKPGIVLDIPK